MAPQPLVRLLVATLAAAGATAVLPVLTIIGIIAAPFVFIVATGHALIIGLPIALVCNQRGWITALNTIAGGFFIGAIPVGLLMAPDFFRSSGGALLIAFVFGAFGAVGGAAFWLTLRNMAKKDTALDLQVFE